MQQERFRNTDPDSMNLFKTRWVQSQRLFSRVRSLDPPVQREGVPVDSFTVAFAPKEPGGPLIAGTWFDLRPWHITVTATRFEIKDKSGMIEVPYEQRVLGEFAGAEYRDCYSMFDLARREGGWDRIDCLWSRGEQ
jgi:hypothetical protein